MPDAKDLLNICWTGNKIETRTFLRKDDEIPLTSVLVFDCKFFAASVISSTVIGKLAELNILSKFLQNISGCLLEGTILLATFSAMVEKWRLNCSAITFGSEVPIPLIFKKSTVLLLFLFALIASFKIFQFCLKSFCVFFNSESKYLFLPL